MPRWCSAQPRPWLRCGVTVLSVPSLSRLPHFPPLLPLQTEDATGLIGPLKCHHDRYVTDCKSLPVAPTAAVFTTPYRGPIRAVSHI